MVSYRRRLHKSQSPNHDLQRSRNLGSSLYGGSKKNWSASDKERRDEEKRRSERKDDVVIGKTSAKRGESDYPIDPKATEQEYLRQASQEEKQIFHRTERGMELLNSVGI